MLPGGIVAEPAFALVDSHCHLDASEYDAIILAVAVYVLLTR